MLVRVGQAAKIRVPTMSSRASEILLSNLNTRSSPDHKVFRAKCQEARCYETWTRTDSNLAILSNSNHNSNQTPSPTRKPSKNTPMYDAVPNSGGGLHFWSILPWDTQVSG